MKYNKPFLSFDDQINLLESRGLIFPDKAKAQNYFSNISYYRLSAYMLPLKQKGSEDFQPNTTFDDVLNLYLFDREFRIVVFDAVERIEIAFRTQIIHQFSLSGGAFWFENPIHFNNNYFYSKNLSKIDEEIDRSNEVFIDHFRQKYTSSNRPPAWMTLEVVSIGLLSKLYKNLNMSPAKKAISNHFQIPNPYVLESWMQSITYVRNIVAHHSRLWNRVLTLKPALPKKPKNDFPSNILANNTKIYPFLCCLLYLLRTINPNTKFAANLKQLFDEYPNVPQKSMGFPADWQDETFWK
jgi:abortive infection bacteriophage resistance protein